MFPRLSTISAMRCNLYSYPKTYSIMYVLTSMQKMTYLHQGVGKLYVWDNINNIYQKNSEKRICYFMI